MQFPVAPLTSLVCLFVSEVPVYCNECNKVFELVVSQQACPQCRFSVLSASKVLNDDGYIVQRPAAAEAWKKCLSCVLGRVCALQRLSSLGGALALEVPLVALRRKSSLGGAPALKFLGWRSGAHSSLGGGHSSLGGSGAQVPWVALLRSQFLGWRPGAEVPLVALRCRMFLGWRSGAQCSLGGAPALNKFLAWRSGAQVPWVVPWKISLGFGAQVPCMVPRSTCSLGGAPALDKFLGWRSGAQVPWVALRRTQFLWWRSRTQVSWVVTWKISLGWCSGAQVPWVVPWRHMFLGWRSGAR